MTIDDWLKKVRLLIHYALGKRRQVAAGIIEKGGMMLIARRKDGAFAGLWEFPGGKIEPGETPEACLKREIEEELAITIHVGPFFMAATFRYCGVPIEILSYRATYESGTIELRDHTEVRWVRSADLASFSFVPGDKPIIRHLLSTCENYCA